MEQIQSLQMRQELKHILRMEQARLLEIPEEVVKIVELLFTGTVLSAVDWASQV